MKTFCVKTLGCKVNQCDSQNMRDVFFHNGWVEGGNDASADICIVNTCCVTRQADRKSRYAIRAAIRQNPRSKVLVTGCYAGYDRAAIEKIDGVDAVFENSQKDRLYESAIGADSLSCQNRRQRTSGGRTRAFLKIQDGCNNRCSYCIVPLVRGPSKSKDRLSVLKEAGSLVKDGYKEIVLTGVCLGSYGKDLEPKLDLVDVISGIEKIDGSFRIRLSSIEASDVSDRLIAKMAESKKLCPHLHIPFQSGDDEVLAAMNKKLNVSDYMQIVSKAKSAIKGLSITCDIIVGFPQEKEKNFINTLKFLKEIIPLQTHIFSFSERRGAAIYGRKGRVSPVELDFRLKSAKSLAEELSGCYVRGYLGKELEVLFEAKDRGLWQGYSRNYIKVGVACAQSLHNSVKLVKIVDSKAGLAIGDDVR
ncbi:MAG: tRNA (N(6)-L-threonylcarbamoyladenosine(37)-C(2))-methylthiotransferase MtaB [Candidatus Omnitrophica bacterium]|nr:tRNA (N(6)-L-threonylcarbamoyladenosine(37)-C(2))-methylthiotransferase MtaB [Candidatus Omnitrophota bacterium]